MIIVYTCEIKQLASWFVFVKAIYRFNYNNSMCFKNDFLILEQNRFARKTQPITEGNTFIDVYRDRLGLKHQIIKIVHPSFFCF